MTSIWPAAYGGSRFDDAGSVGGSSKGTILTASATVNAKGSYAELIASTPIAAAGFVFIVQNASALTDYLIDLAIGGAGSEKIILPNFLVSGDILTVMEEMTWPIPIAEGQRISARCQAADASATIVVQVLLIAEGSSFFPGSLGRVTAYGVDTSDSGAATIDPGATAHTKGSYVELIASLTNPMRHAVLAFGNRNNAARILGEFLMDLAVGGSGSEKIVVPDLYVFGGQGERVGPPAISIPLTIAAGERLSARAQCSITDATDRLFDLAVYGIE